MDFLLGLLCFYCLVICTVFFYSPCIFHNVSIFSISWKAENECIHWQKKKLLFTLLTLANVDLSLAD